MKQEFGEVEEPVPPGTVGSSTMPQKRNPKLAQDIVAAAAQIRVLVPLALEAMQTEHEADRTTSMMMDRALIDACGLMGDILQRLSPSSRVYRSFLSACFDIPQRWTHHGRSPDAGTRQAARTATPHDIVYEAAQGAVTQGRPFHALLAEDRHIMAHLTPQQITDLLDPSHYTGLCRPFAEQGAQRARQVAAGLASRHQRHT